MTHYSPAEVLAAALRASVGLDPAIQALGIEGTAVFAPRMPDQPNVAIAVRDTGSRGEGRYMRTGETVTKPTTQIRVRSTNHTEGWNIIYSLAKWADSVKMLGVVMDNGSVIYLRAVHRVGDPLPLGPEDGGQRFHFTLNTSLTLEI